MLRYRLRSKRECHAFGLHFALRIICCVGVNVLIWQVSLCLPVYGGDQTDWLHFRGPMFNGTSNETGLADKWPEQGPPVLWTREMGVGYSGFAAQGDHVFTMAQSAYSQFVVCLDADTGDEIWRHRFDWPYDGAGVYPGPRATPTLSGDRLYYSGPRGQIGCLRIETGREVWSVNVIEKFDGRGFDFGYAASPLVVDGKVVVPVGGKGASVVALDAETGDVIWKSGDGAASYIGVIPIEVNGQSHVVAFLQSSLTAFELDTGRQLWKDTFSQGYDEHAVAPIYREPLLMIASPFKAGADMYRIEAVSPNPEETTEDAAEVEATGAKQAGAEKAIDHNARWLWHNPKLSSDTASSALVGDLLFGFDLKDLQAKRRRPSRGEFRCLDWSTGNVRWSSQSPGHATVIAADEKLFLFNDNGELILASASPDEYIELGRGSVFDGEICWTAPTLSNGRLFLRSPSRCACVYVGEPPDLAEETATRAIPLAKIPKASSIDLSWMISGERPYPFDTHSMVELRRWYAATMVGFATAGILGLLVRLGLRQASTLQQQRASQGFAAMSAIVLGLVMTPILNSRLPDFYFTWPLALYVCYQATLLAMIWARDTQAPSGGRRRYARLSLLAFVGVCLSYFLLCRRLSHTMEWLFLIGFVPSALFAIPAAVVLYRRSRWLEQFVAVALAYTVYFWGSASVNWWLA